MVFKSLDRWRSRRKVETRGEVIAQGTEQLINRGFYRLGETGQTAEHYTCLVVGVARSGTSILAGALHHLGLFMGDDCDQRPAFEDPRLRDGVLQGDWQATERLIARYNASHSRWGTKLPVLLHYLDTAQRLFRNPRYIVIYRDVFAIANRNRISMKADLLQDMQRSLQEYQLINDFLATRKPPALLVSQCTALQDKEGLLEQLVNFCELQPGKARIASALDFIQRDPETYLQLSRITRAEGAVTSVDHGRVCGWARYLNSDRAPVVVLFVDGSEVDRVVADLPVDDFLSIEPSGGRHCGFCFKLDESILLSGRLLGVRVEDDVNELPFALG